MIPTPGPRNLLSDVPGLRVGHAVDADIGTGVSVILPDQPVVCGMDARGGGVGALGSELLSADSVVERIDALVLAGGSQYGLGAVQGVASVLAQQGRGHHYMGTIVPVVPGAIIFDLLAQHRRDWLPDPPYARLGAQAVTAITDDFALGSVGAGLGASASSFAGGVGSASARLPDGLVVGALAVVNSFGEVVIPGTRHFWAWPYEMNAEFGGLGPPPDPAPLAPGLSLPPSLRPPGTNTTLVVVGCNLTLDRGAARRLAIMAQAGLTRAIRPVHTPFDGDVVYALATGDLPAPDVLGLTRAGDLAADCVARAIARAVYLSSGTPRRPAYRSRACNHAN